MVLLARYSQHRDIVDLVSRLDRANADHALVGELVPLDPCGHQLAAKMNLPGESFTVGGNDIDSYGSPLNLFPSNTREWTVKIPVLSKAGPFVYLGCIAYSDGVGKLHHTRFCYEGLIEAAEGTPLVFCRVTQDAN